MTGPSLASNDRVVRAVQHGLGRYTSLDRVVVDRPGECRVLLLRSGNDVVVAKVLPMESIGAVHDRHVDIWHATRSCSVLNVAEPLMADADLGVVVTRLLPGRSASEDPRPAHAAMIGHALAELHALGPDPAARTYALTDDIVALVRPEPTRLAEIIPRFAEPIGRAFAHLTEPRANVAVTRVHRDFHLRQILLADGRVGVVDWDDAANGDPAFDVAYFLTYLETHGYEPGLATAFLRAYNASAPMGEAFAGRLADYRIFNLLRRASRRCRLREPGWQSEAARMLDAMARSLPQADAA